MCRIDYSTAQSSTAHGMCAMPCQHFYNIVYCHFDVILLVHKIDISTVCCAYFVMKCILYVASNYVRYRVNLSTTSAWASAVECENLVPSTSITKMPMRTCLIDLHNLSLWKTNQQNKVHYIDNIGHVHFYRRYVCPLPVVTAAILP